LIDHFFTISKIGNGLYKEKGSKFLAFAYPVSDLDAINQKLETLRKEYHDARHHCYAYILGNEAKKYRANDDGEPNHSAGDPILGQIRSFKLTNTLIVVIRYFGGTKLGVSGLINAYKTAAEEALNNSIVLKQFITAPLHLTYTYSSTNEIMKLIDTYELKIIEQEFSEKCMLRATVIISRYPSLIDEIQLLIDTGSEINLVKAPQQNHP